MGAITKKAGPHMPQQGSGSNQLEPPEALDSGGARRTMLTAPTTASPMPTSFCVLPVSICSQMPRLTVNTGIAGCREAGRVGAC